VAQVCVLNAIYCVWFKETNRRQLHFVVPRVIPFSPQMRFVEDNPASISLLDIYKQVTSSQFGCIVSKIWLVSFRMNPLWLMPHLVDVDI